MYRLGILFLLVLTLSLSGCGPKNTNPVLSGTVTWDGAPMPEGSIGFEGAAGDAFEVAIVDGKYNVQLPAGKKKVRIRWTKAVKYVKTDESDKDPVYEQIIPEKYNLKTTLECEVPATGGTSDFNLTSK